MVPKIICSFIIATTVFQQIYPSQGVPIIHENALEALIAFMHTAKEENFGDHYKSFQIRKNIKAMDKNSQTHSYQLLIEPKEPKAAQNITVSSILQQGSTDIQAPYKVSFWHADLDSLQAPTTNDNVYCGIIRLLYQKDKEKTCFSRLACLPFFQQKTFRIQTTYGNYIGRRVQSGPNASRIICYAERTLATLNKKFLQLHFYEPSYVDRMLKRVSQALKD